MDFEKAIKECELFEYSQTYFDAQKIDYKIEILEMQLNAINTINESLTESQYNAINENAYFVESLNNDEICDLEELILLEKRNLFDRIGRFISNLWKRIQEAIAEMMKKSKIDWACELHEEFCKCDSKMETNAKIEKVETTLEHSGHNVDVKKFYSVCQDIGRMVSNKFSAESASLDLGGELTKSFLKSMSDMSLNTSHVTMGCMFMFSSRVDGKINKYKGPTVYELIDYVDILDKDPGPSINDKLNTIIENCSKARNVESEDVYIDDRNGKDLSIADRDKIIEKHDEANKDSTNSKVMLQHKKVSKIMIEYISVKSEGFAKVYNCKSNNKTDDDD